MASAIQLIRRDHKKVEALFDKFDQQKKPEGKIKICEQVIEELEIHTTLEEEIFYPAVRRHLGEEDFIEEAQQEHQDAKDIIAELKEMGPEDSDLDGKFSKLVESIKHHVAEEEGELLPKVEESDMDLNGYGEEMAERKQELLDESDRSHTHTPAGGRAPTSRVRRRRPGQAA